MNNYSNERRDNMKKVFKLENLDCVACASKMEEAIQKIEGVESISVNFMTQKMKVEVINQNYDTIMTEIKKVCKKIEPDCTILDK